MKFDVYGRFVVEVKRENGAWAVYRIGLGTRVRFNDILPPPDLKDAELAVFLDDVFHELSGPGERIEPAE